MLFSTHSEREDYFRRLDNGEVKPSIGTAVTFAMEMNLGVWGEGSEEFRADVARIFAAELKIHFPNQLRKAMGFINIRGSDVLETNAFEAMLRLARKPRQAGIHNVVRSLGDNSSHMDRKDPKLCEHDIANLAHAHHSVISEISARCSSH